MTLFLVGIILSTPPLGFSQAPSLHRSRYFALSLTFRKAASLDVITDPPVVLHTEPKIGLIGSNYEQ